VQKLSVSPVDRNSHCRFQKDEAANEGGLNAWLAVKCSACTTDGSSFEFSSARSI
jgi:hypothetical protein